MFVKKQKQVSIMFVKLMQFNEANFIFGDKKSCKILLGQWNW